MKTEPRKPKRGRPERLATKLRRWKGDFPAFCEENLYIKTKEGTLVPFVLNRAQRRFWSRVEREIKAGRPIRIYILKARQLGFSTVIKALEYWLVTLNPYRNSLTVSHSVDSAVAMFEKHSIFYSMAPSDCRPARTRSNRREMLFKKEPTDDEIAVAEAKGEKPDIGLQSSLLVQTAADQHLGASFTIHFAHLSEFARYEKIRNDVDTSMVTLTASVPNMPMSFIFLETTAYGLGYAKKFWDKENNGFIKMFVSWVADEKYRYDTWQEEFPNAREDFDEIPDGPYGDEIDVAKRVEAELEEWYPEDFEDEEWREEEVMARMAWRRRSIRNDHQGDLGLFQQEYPIYAEEAFLTSGDHVFDTRKLADMKSALMTDDERGFRLPLYPPTRYRYNKRTNEFKEAKYGHLRVYEKPERGERYVMGADASEGVSHGDASAAVVLKLPELKQVAVLHTGYRNDDETVAPVDPDDFAYMCNALGRWYNTAFICAEVNGPGFATNLKLGKDLRYPKLYRREVFDPKYRNIQKKYGWHSNGSTKNVMVTDLRAVIRDDGLVLYDLPTIHELSHYVKDGKQMEAATGEHDDLVIALGLALQMALKRNFGDRVSQPRRQRGPKEFTFAWWGQQVDRQQEVA